jgi:hypothetical protein
MGVGKVTVPVKVGDAMRALDMSNVLKEEFIVAI